ncbi:hypothetical protein WA158_005586 [Blastocystis sp. Blastoise]
MSSINFFGGMKEKDQVEPDTSVVDGLASWETHTKGVASKMLLKMGFTGRLGKNADGISKPIAVKVRPANLGLGANDFQEATHLKQNREVAKEYFKTMDIDVEDKEKESESNESDYEDDWRIDTKQVKPKKVKTIKTVSDILNDPNEQPEQMAFIDMTGEQPRTIYLNNEKTDKYSPENIKQLEIEKRPVGYELLYNMNMMVDLKEGTVLHAKSELNRIHKEKEEIQKTIDMNNKLISNSKQEVEQLENVMRYISIYKEKIDKYLNTVQSTHIQLSSSLSTSSLQNTSNSQGNKFVPSDKISVYISDDNSALVNTCNILKFFENLQMDYALEYERYSLFQLLPSLYNDILSYELEKWNPLQNPEVLEYIRLHLEDVFILDDEYTIESVWNTIEVVLFTVILPQLRTAFRYWDVRQTEPAIRLITALSHIYPKNKLYTFIQSTIYQKLQVEVDVWDPSTETVRIDKWILPWESFIPKSIENLYPSIRYKISSLIPLWIPADISLFYIVSPFKGHWKNEEMNSFLIKYIMPKLDTYFRDYVIDPNCQDIDVFNQIVLWNDLLPSTYIGALFESLFFPKWLSVLYKLLYIPTIDLNDIYIWVNTWVDLFPSTMRENPLIMQQLGRAWDLINEYLEGTGVYNPSLFTYQQSYIQIIEDIVKERNAKNMVKSSKARYYDITMREVLEKFAGINNLEYHPLANRLYKNIQIYLMGTCIIYTENDMVYIQKDGDWKPIAIEDILKEQ